MAGRVRSGLVKACVVIGVLGAFDVATLIRESSAPVRILDDLLSRRLSLLSVRSATFRAAMDSLRASGFQVVVAQPQQARRDVPGMRSYAAIHVGEVIPLRDRGNAIVGAVVTVDVPRLEELAREVGASEAALATDVDRILIHELYGHVVPLAASRTIAGGCPDPAPGAPASSSCAMQRENRIRAELGIAPRRSYDLSGLEIGRRLEDAPVTAAATPARAGRL